MRKRMVVTEVERAIWLYSYNSQCWVLSCVNDITMYDLDLSVLPLLKVIIQCYEQLSYWLSSYLVVLILFATC